MPGMNDVKAPVAVYECQAIAAGLLPEGQQGVVRKDFSVGLHLT